MNYYQFKALQRNRAFVFSNSATGGGDGSTDANAAATVDPNNHLSPIIGGSKTFNIFVSVSLAVVVIALGYLVFKSIKK